MEKENELPEIKTYFTFGGMDLLIVLNKKVYGEIDTFEVNSIKKQLIIGVSNFLSVTTILKELSRIKDGELYELYSNEYGDTMYRKFLNLKYVGELYNTSVNEIAPSHKLIFDYTPSEDNFYKEIDENKKMNLKSSTLVDAIKNGEL